MDLWIRSQDKKILMEVEQLMLINANPFTINGASKNYDYDLGTYKTKERALEVLDEIQKTIETHILGQTSTEWDTWYKGTVYQMPEE